MASKREIQDFIDGRIVAVPAPEIAVVTGATARSGTVVCEGRIGGPICAVADNRVSVDSTGDARIENNVVRHEYRVLSDREKEQMKSIKDAGRDFIEYLDHVGASSEHSRELALAKTKVQEAVMWAVNHVTK